MDEEKNNNPVVGNGAGAPLPKVRTVYDMPGVRDYLQMRRGNTAPLRETPDNVETTAHHLVQETAILHHNLNISGQAIAEAAARTTARIAATPVPEEPADIDVAPLRRIAREAERTAVESYDIATARRNRRKILIYGTTIAAVAGTATWLGLRARNNTASNSSSSIAPTAAIAPSNPRNFITANASFSVNAPEISWFKGLFSKK